MRGLTKSEKLQKNMREQKGDELGGVSKLGETSPVCSDSSDVPPS